MRRTGFTLIELVVVMAIIAILLSAGIPSLADYLQASRIRALSEQLSSDLKSARSEALYRNRMVTFRISGTGWSYAVPSVPTFAGYASTPAELSTSVLVTSSQASLCFDGTGRVLLGDCSGPPAAPPQFDLSSVSGLATCKAKGGSTQCLRVNVSVAGQARVCDPAAASSNVAAC